MHVSKNGEIAIVWISIDPVSKHVHVYDCALFKTEVPAVIADSINNRGRWIPLAWAHEEMSQSFLERGCKMLPEPTSDSEEMAEIVSRDIWERMRAKRITADKRLKNWGEEANGLLREKGKIPKDSHPLMSATRIAMQNIRSAKRQQSKRVNKKQKRGIAIV
jgi:hypothetical protein